MEICGGMGTAGRHECLGRPGDCSPGSSFNLDRLGDLRLVGCPKPARAAVVPFRLPDLRHFHRDCTLALSFDVARTVARIEGRRCSVWGAIPGSLPGSSSISGCAGASCRFPWQRPYAWSTCTCTPYARLPNWIRVNVTPVAKIRCSAQLNDFLLPVRR